MGVANRILYLSNFYVPGIAYINEMAMLTMRLPVLDFMTASLPVTAGNSSNFIVFNFQLNDAVVCNFILVVSYCEH